MSNSKNNSQQEEQVLDQDIQEQDRIEQTVSLEDFQKLEQELERAKTREKLALADYQNMIRRSNEERARMMKLATLSFVRDLIQPLSHLSLATMQIKDKGLDMVVTQLWQTLEAQGLEKIDCLGKEFDVDTMEVVDKGENAKVVKTIVTDGYKLNGEVIQHAKVVLD